jgi:hypothetical protein
MNSIIIARFGKLGYQIFSYMLAHVLCQESRNSKIYAQNRDFLSMFNFKLNYKVSKNPHIVIDKKEIVTREKIEQIAKELEINNEQFLDVLISNVTCNIKLYEEYFVELKELFQNTVETPVVGEDKLLINLNYRDEILNLAPYHTDYIQPPLSFYKQIVETTGLLPVFSGIFPRTKEFIDNLNKGFPGAEYIDPNPSANYEFELIRRAKNKAISVSTFSYLAAYFGEADTKIHMPLYGFINPEQRPDVDLIPTDTSRFVVYDNFPVKKLNKTAAQVSEMLLL